MTSNTTNKWEKKRENSMESKVECANKRDEQQTDPFICGKKGT